MKLEFFEPPAVPGFGAAGGFSLRLLDKTNTPTTSELGEVTDKFMDALRKRKELKGLFTFFAANYPQYELVIDNDAGDAEGRVDRKTRWTTSSILVGSTYEQGFVRFGQFFKVYVQAAPEFRRLPSDLQNMFVKNEHGGDGPLLRVHDRSRRRRARTRSPATTCTPRPPSSGGPAPGYSSGEAIKAVAGGRRRDAAPRLRHRLGGPLLRRGEQAGTRRVYIFLVVVVVRVPGAGRRSTRASSCRWR